MGHNISSIYPDGNIVEVQGSSTVGYRDRSMKRLARSWWISTN